MEKSERHSIKQLLKVNIISVETGEAHNITTVGFLPQIHNLCLIMKKHQATPIKEILQNYQLASLKGPRQRMKNCSRLNVDHN